MKDKGLVTFFDVKRCGFYRIRKGKDQDQLPERGGFQEAISKVAQWMEGRDFDQTIPWDPKKSAHRQRYYCKSVAENPETGDYLFVFWKQYADDSGNLNGIVADSKFGETNGDSVKVGNKVKGKTVIYGQPMYYWFIPEHNLIASIKFSHSVSDTMHICNYIKNCIDFRIKDKNKTESENTRENNVTGDLFTIKRVTYKSDKGDYHLVFHLESSLKKKIKDDINLADLANKITHIVVRDTISTSKKDDRSSNIAIWDKIVRKKPETFASKNIELVSEANLDESSLREIMEAHSEVYTPGTSWNNIGFKFDRHESTKWFNEYIERRYLIVEDKKGFNEIYYPADVLLRRLSAERDSLLSTAIKPDDSDEILRKAVGGE